MNSKMKRHVSFLWEKQWIIVIIDLNDNNDNSLKNEKINYYAGKQI